VSILEQMRDDVVGALKAGDRGRARALRTVLAELQRAAKEARGGAVDETQVLRRERKRRVEAAEAYRTGGREDLAAAEDAEAEIIDGYLPAELSDAALAALVDDAVAESGATSSAEMGRVMPLAMARVAGRADGRRVSTLVRDRLGG
jgi:uncharacterized protein YqeY